MQQACVTEDMAEEVLRGTLDVKAAIHRYMGADVQMCTSCDVDVWMLRS